MSVRTALRTKRLVTVASIPVAVVASGALVWQSSYAAFSDTTENPASNWASGTVDLEDDDAGTALFTVSNMKPGATGTKCINVTSSGSLASTVKLYGTGFTSTKSLGDVINLKVEQGTGSTSAACAGFTADAGAALVDGTLSGFAGARTGFGNGVGTWAPTGASSQTKSFRVTYTFSSAATNAYQGGSAALGLTWEAQNS